MSEVYRGRGGYPEFQGFQNRGRGGQFPRGRGGQISRGRGGYTNPPSQTQNLEKKEAIVKWVDKDGEERFFFSQSLVHESRTTVANFIQDVIDDFSKSQNKSREKFIASLQQKIFQEAIYKGNRKLMFVIEYCVHAGLIEVFENPDIMVPFKARVQVDINVRNIGFDFYNLRELASGSKPRKAKQEQFDAFRAFFWTPENEVKMLELIEKYDPSEKSPIDRSCFGDAKQPAPMPIPTKTKMLERGMSLLSVDDWEKYLESKGNLKSTDEIDSDFHSPVTEGYLYGACIKTGNIVLFESALKSSSKTPQQKKVLIEKQLCYFLDCIQESKITKQDLTTLTKLVISGLSYHPLGCYDKKHFPLADKLNEMTNDTSLSQEIKDLANISLTIIKESYGSMLCAKLVSDFVSKNMNYGYLGFQGLHQFCFENYNSEYIKQIASAFFNRSILRDLVIDFVKKTFVINEAHSFNYNFYQELLTFSKETQDDALKNELKCDMKKYALCSSEAFINFVLKSISGDTDVSSCKEEFVRNSIAFANELCNKYSNTQLKEKAKTAFDYARKIEKPSTVEKAIQNLSKDFEFFLNEAIEEISGSHILMEEIRITLTEKLIQQISTNISIDKNGEPDEEFANDIQKEIIGGITALLRKETNCYVMEINQKLIENQNADIAQDKKELLYYFETHSHILSFLTKTNSHFIAKFNANLKKIQTNIHDEDGVFAFF